jgi:hypothetical protein
MKWRIPIVFIAIAFMVSAQVSLKFHKPGISKEEFEFDKKTCITHAVSHRQELGSEGGTTGREPTLLEGIELTSTEHRLALVCMLEKGYRFVTVE